MKIIVTGDEAPAENLYRTAIRYLNYRDVELLSVDDFEGILQAGKNLTHIDAYWITGRQRKRLTSLLTSIDPILKDRVNVGLPKLLLLTMFGVNNSHGLGVHVTRLVEFLGYPHSHLLNVCCYSEAYANAIQYIEVRPGEVTSPAFERKMELVTEWADESEVYLWSFAVEKEDSDLLRAVSNYFSGRITQKRQHFYDWLPSTGQLNLGIFKENLLCFGGVMSSYMPDLTEHVRTVMNLPCETYTNSLFFPAERTANASQNSPPPNELRIVLIGNIWAKEAPDGVTWYEALDRALYEQIHRDERISVTWYADPVRVQKTLEAANFYHAKCLIWRGFLPSLGEELTTFDLGLIPHSPEKEMVTNYTAYSVPSRILDYVSSGLPTLAITPRNSGLHKKILAEDLGYSLTFEEFKSRPNFLVSLVTEKVDLLKQRKRICKRLRDELSNPNTFAYYMLRRSDFCG